MGTQPLDAALDTSAPLQLIRAAAALRWRRPDLTVTLAELALDAADDAATWVAAAGWLLHGRALLGDGRQIACDLLDGLARWADIGAELMAGPQGRRLRIELAGPARRTGEQTVARALLAAEPGVDAADGEMRADVLTELARCAVDETPDTADAALDAAEQAWAAAGREPGIASVLLVRAARDRRAGRLDAAVAAAVAGLARVNPGGRRAGATESDHLAAALTAEWIAALVDAGRLDEVRGDAVPAATRLLATTRPSRQLAGLRLAVARVAAVDESADTVLAALEPAAQDAAAGDVPELEAACRSMLGELHEAAGRLDAALSAVRAAMAAERCDHDRGARLRARLAAVTASWAGRPSGHGVVRHPALSALTGAPLHTAAGGTAAGRGGRLAPVEDAAPGVDVAGVDVAGADGGTGAGGPGPGDPTGEAASDAPAATSDRAARARARAGTWSGAAGAGRRARRLAAEAADGPAGQGWSDAALPELGIPTAQRSHPDPQVPGAGTQAVVEVPENRFDDADGALRPVPADTSPGHRRFDRARHEGSPLARTPGEVGARSTDTGRSVRGGGGSLIGDALFRELIEHAGPHRASTGEPRPPAPGHDGGGAHPIDSRTERWHPGEGDAGQGGSAECDPVRGNGPPRNGTHAVARTDTAEGGRRRDDAPAPAVRRTGADVADTVVLELGRRPDPTVAVPPVQPVRTPADDVAARHDAPGRGSDPGADALRAAVPADAGGLPRRPRPAPGPAVDAGPDGPAAGSAPDLRNGPAATDTVRVAPPEERERAGTARRSEPIGRAGAPAGPPTRGPADAPGVGEPDAPEPGPARPRPHGSDRVAGTDGLGIGDLLAGALAAYRGI